MLTQNVSNFPCHSQLHKHLKTNTAAEMHCTVAIPKLAPKYLAQLLLRDTAMAEWSSAWVNHPSIYSTCQVSFAMCTEFPAAMASHKLVTTVNVVQTYPKGAAFPRWLIQQNHPGES